ncbi:protein kinase domain-containing protein [Streptomyces acidiscabies]|uniref:class III lanthionine synthetase LanKC N-terminal domain-containing protein n=1 Tax=Streptomyces acidiscabies TaxID=42234 RepID=UPI0038F5EDBF
MPGDRVTEWRETLTDDANTLFTSVVTPLLGPGWETRSDGFWLHARTTAGRLPAQGWKLHVSAVPHTAGAVLAACVPVLRAHGVAFKCAEDTAVLLHLLSSRYGADGTGKFLTVYPPDADTCAGLADLLAEATTGLAGPLVPSDARWLPDAPVHYRYGPFTTENRLTDDGRSVPVLLRPDGTAEPDVRDRFAPPSWAPALPRPPLPRPARSARPPLLADRYRVRSVLRRSARGGVFTGEDTVTGRPVVVKHARAHVGTTPAGLDARDVLRHEARVLRELSGTGVVPALLDVVETGHASYLVETQVTGAPLNRFVAEGWRPGRTVGDQVWRVATSLAHAVATVHATGWTLCDLSPGNVIVGADGRCTLVDLELAARPGDLVPRDSTPGYTAPEQTYASLVDRAPGAAADCHALGCLLFLLAAGRDPLHLNGTWSAGRQLAGQLADLTDRHGFAAAVAPLVAALLCEDPGYRPSAAQTEAHLTHLSKATRGTHEGRHRLGSPGGAAVSDGCVWEVAVPAAPTAPDQSTPAVHQAWPLPGFGAVKPRQPQPRPLPATPHKAPGLRAVLADGIGELVEHIHRHGPAALRLDAPWRSPRDRLGVDFGLSGPLLLLARALSVPSARTGTDAGRLRDAVRQLAEHAEGRRGPDSLAPGPRLGLATGEAGRIWALWDAAEALGDDALRDRLLVRAAELTPAVPAPPGAGPLRLSLGHGIAGLGTLHLRLHLATGSPRLRRSALACADALLTASGTAAPGLMEGTAGTTWFLLALGHTLDHAPAVVRAERAVRECAGRVLAETVVSGARLGHHNGLAGEGRLLAAAARLGIPTEDALERLEDAFDGWHSTAPTGLARGISGWAEFLLDRGHPAAGRTLSALVARANVRHGRITVPDDSGAYAGHALADGGGGPLWVLLRAVAGGPGLWDPRPVRAETATSAGSPDRART